MTACCLLGILALLLVLPLCLCEPHAVFFSTRSARPWSHRQRWRLPKLAAVASGEGSGTFLSSCILAPSVNDSTDRTARRQSDHLRSAGHGDGVNGGGGDGGGDALRSPCEDRDDRPSVGLQRSQVLYAFGLLLWLALLFYLLGTTASDYFSCTLEKLSDVLNLSPAVAGVTLLAIGNGAPDVFSTVAAFAASDHTGSIGFSSVLGGALFITTVISGTVALVACKGKEEPKFGLFRRSKQYNPQTVNESPLLVDPLNGPSHISVEDGLVHEKASLVTGKEDGHVREKKAVLSTEEAEAIVKGLVVVDWSCFIRDVVFLLLSIGALTLVLLDGEVHLWEALAFLCVYVCYTVFVWTAEILQSRRRKRRSSLLEPLIIKDAIENAYPAWAEPCQSKEHPHPYLHPHPHPHYHVHSQDVEEEIERRWEDSKDHSIRGKVKHWLLMFYKYAIEWVLAWPRRLTIPVIEEERWSRKLAIASCTLAPIFVAAVWSRNYSDYVVTTLVALSIGSVVGVVLGSLAFFSTDEEQPPQNFISLWLAGGFVMSIVWFFLVASELVESLEILGSIFGISMSVLALTVLAWGNSVGDLVADVALACSGPDGVQIAIAGCYAGPLFNIVVGLGLSLIIGCWNSEPDVYQIVDKDGSLFYIAGFLAVGLIWAAVVLPLQGMRPGRVFGIGLIALYCGFFVVGMCYTAGWLT